MSHQTMSYRIGLLFALVLCACAIPSHAQTLVTDIAVSGSPSGVGVNPATKLLYTSDDSGADVVHVISE
jgi:hypothetical protein